MGVGSFRTTPMVYPTQLMNDLFNAMAMVCVFGIVLECLCRVRRGIPREFPGQHPNLHAIMISAISIGVALTLAGIGYSIALTFQALTSL
jgi:hypothetical protein